MGKVVAASAMIKRGGGALLRRRPDSPITPEVVAEPKEFAKRWARRSSI